MVRAVAETARQGLTAQAIAARVDAFLTGAEAVRVSSLRWSTHEMLAIEAEALRLAASGPRTRPVPAAVAAAAIDQRPSLSPE